MPRGATGKGTPPRVRRRSFARTWSRRLVGERALLQQARRIALDALTQPCDVVRRRAEIAAHLIDAALLRQRVPEISKQCVNLVQRLDRLTLGGGELRTGRS